MTKGPNYRSSCSDLESVEIKSPVIQCHAGAVLQHDSWGIVCGQQTLKQSNLWDGITVHCRTASDVGSGMHWGYHCKQTHTLKLHSMSHRSPIKVFASPHDTKPEPFAEHARLSNRYWCIDTHAHLRRRATHINMIMMYHHETSHFCAAGNQISRSGRVMRDSYRVPHMHFILSIVQAYYGFLHDGIMSSWR